MKAREALNTAVAGLLAAGREDGQRIARLLLEEALGQTGAGFINALGVEMDAWELSAFRQMTDRAIRGEPAQYILGHWDFWGRLFTTDSRALIPRPETELLVETALADMAGDTALDILDIGCGTGCIGITVKLERSACRVSLCDISEAALQLAHENATRLGADVRLFHGDMRRILPGGPYDVLLSNPPYITSADMDTLSPVVRGHEPHLALYGGDDGLDFIRALADRAGDSLKPGGSMAIEVGYDQANPAMEILKNAGMAASALPDYSGILRVILARKVR